MTRMIDVWNSDLKQWEPEKLSDESIYCYSLEGVIMRNVDDKVFWMFQPPPTDEEINDAITTMNTRLD